MRHVDPDVLALLALGEQVALPEDSAHVSECEQCRSEIEVLSRAAMVGRSTFDAGELLQPPVGDFPASGSADNSCERNTRCLPRLA